MKTLEPIIAEHPFFQGLDERHIDLLVGCAANQVFRPEEFLCRVGEPADHFYMVREGMVAIEIDRGGGQIIQLQSVSAGDVMGWSWLIPPHTWRFDARAVELTRTIALDGKCLRQKCEDDRDFGFELLRRFSRIMAARLEATRLQLLDIYGADS